VSEEHELWHGWGRQDEGKSVLQETRLEEEDKFVPRLRGSQLDQRLCTGGGVTMEARRIARALHVHEVHYR
jgi:hypothetical protein